MRGIKALLVGESKTGKSACLDTLPRALIDFSFDIGGWRSLAITPDKKRTLGPEEEEVWLTVSGKPLTVIRNLSKWWDANTRPFLPGERIIVDYAHGNKVKMGQYIELDTGLITMFFKDSAIFWDKQEECIKRGLCHIGLDSLSSFQYPILGYTAAMNGRVMITVQDYGQAILKIDEVLQGWIALPFDFVITAHSQVEKDDLSGEVRETLLVYGKNLPNQILAKIDDIFLSEAVRVAGGLHYQWGTSRSGPTQVYVQKGFEKTAPDSHMAPYRGVPVGTRSFRNLPPRVEQDFLALYKDKLFVGGER